MHNKMTNLIKLGRVSRDTRGWIGMKSETNLWFGDPMLPYPTREAR